MAGFEAIYEEHFHSVYRYVFSLCRDEILAEEITQETFYKALENLHQFDGRCRLFVWLCQIAKNTYFSHLKKQKQRIAQVRESADSHTANSLDEALFDQSTAWQLHQLLHQLREPHREVFTLRVFGELSYAQIGELFGKTGNWARLVYYRAKQELRRHLDEYSL